MSDDLNAREKRAAQLVLISFLCIAVIILLGLLMLVSPEITTAVTLLFGPLLDFILLIALIRLYLDTGDIRDEVVTQLKVITEYMRRAECRDREKIEKPGSFFERSHPAQSSSDQQSNRRIYEIKP